MNDLEKIIEWFLKLKQIQQKTEEIQSREKIAGQTQGINQQILQAIIASEKQTLETIKLTRIITLLIILLVIIGITQIIITLAKV